MKMQMIMTQERGEDMTDIDFKVKLIEVLKSIRLELNAVAIELIYLNDELSDKKKGKKDGTTVKS